MRILILGGDGYLGWPTAMYFSRKGHSVGVLDNFAKRRWEQEVNAEPLIPVCSLEERVGAWEEITEKRIQKFAADLQDYDVVADILEKFRPDAIIHFGQQPSAPYSMMDQNRTHGHWNYPGKQQRRSSRRVAICVYILRSDPTNNLYAYRPSPRAWNNH